MNTDPGLFVLEFFFSSRNKSRRRIVGSDMTKTSVVATLWRRDERTEKERERESVCVCVREREKERESQRETER